MYKEIDAYGIIGDLHTVALAGNDGSIDFMCWPDGVAEICDYMPAGRPELKHMLVRRVKTIRGEIKYRLLCEPKFNYGLSRHKTTLRKEGVLFESQNSDQLTLLLRSDLPLKVLAEKYIEGKLEATIDFWRRWIKRSNYQGRWREIVNRSALTLKLLISEKYGSMVASPTFGLPELVMPHPVKFS